MSDQVRFRDLLQGAWRRLPQTGPFLRGLWHLARIKPDSACSLGLLLEMRAREQPQQIALRFEDRSWTYAEFNAWANRLSAVLRLQGVGPGERVAILMENRAEVLALVAATVKLGAVAVMLNHQQRGAALQHSLQLGTPRCLVAGAECLPALETVPIADIPARLWDGEGGCPPGWQALRDLAQRQPAADPPETQSVLARQPCFYIFTSGTTGLPKASVMTHYRWLRGMAGLGMMGLRLTPQDVLYCPLPLYHNNALTVSWGAVLGAGATLALARRFSASGFWQDIRAQGATSFCYIGELCRYLINQPPSADDRRHGVHSMIGNGLRPEIWETFQSRFGIEHISEFYGASEANLAFVNGFGLSRTAGFCPMPFAVVAFDPEQEQPLPDARGRLQKVRPGEVGLLITEVSERTPFDGYTDRRASEAKLLRDVFTPGDCWFNTGDLVRDQGYRHIQFVDRVGDTFRWKGENVATSEVEAVLTRHPDVEQAVVYGVTVPGQEGRAGMAALTLRTPGLDTAGLAAFLRESLPPYAVPCFLRLQREPQTTSTFKYRKVELKREGFDPARVQEPLYVLSSGQRGYEPLQPEHHARILAGDWRF
ncbi:MAG: long-chain-acyl-CoA synthetase [Gammaproteobacteria bacterium]